MEKIRLPVIAIILSLLISISIGCTTPASNSSPASNEISTEDSVELQPRGRGTAELVTYPVHDGTYSAKLSIPDNYTPGDAARIAIPLDGVTLNDIAGLSYWCYIDPDVPVNPDGGYWLPYITFEIDTDGEPGCDTWVIGGGGFTVQTPGVWMENTMESNWLFHVSSVFGDYISPFPLSNMGNLNEIKAATGPDGKTPLGDYTVSKVRLAIGNWGPGGPIGPVICYVDYLLCNDETIF